MSDKAKIAVVKSEDYAQGTEDLFSLIGLNSRLEGIKSVAVKVNLVRVPQNLDVSLSDRSPEKPLPYKWHGNKGRGYTRTISEDGDITRLEHVEALVAYLLKTGVEEITICEGACGWDTHLAYQSLGFYEMAERYGIRIVDTNWAEATVLPVKGGRMLKDLWLAREYVESDFRINLTPMKVHGATCVSLCLKNWAIGIPSAERYGINRTGNRIMGRGDSFPIHRHYDRQELYGQGAGIANTIADVNSAIPYELGIVDGMTTVHYGRLMDLKERRAARGRLPVYRTNLLIAGYDRVAVDEVASRIMGLNPYKIIHIYLSAERGCGAIDPQSIQVLGERVEEVKIKCYPMLKQREVMLH